MVLSPRHTVAPIDAQVVDSMSLGKQWTFAVRERRPDMVLATQTPVPPRDFATAVHVTAGFRSNRGVDRPGRHLHQRRWKEQRLSLEFETRDPDGLAGQFVVRRRSVRSSHPNVAGVIGTAALPTIGRIRS